jgi:DNA-3-methyladenine glycosylase II
VPLNFSISKIREMIYSRQFKLKPFPPFDFHLSALIFSGGDRSISSYEDGTFRKVIQFGQNLFLLNVKSSGSVDSPELLTEVKSPTRVTAITEQELGKVVSTIFNLDLDLEPFYDIAQTDLILAGLIKQLRGLKSPTTATVFEALVDSIVEQQISLNVAHSISKKIIKNFGNSIEVDGERFYAFPTPDKLSMADPEDLRKRGLSFRKAKCIKDISALIENKSLNLESLKAMTEIDKIRDELDKLPGVGVWTAEMTMIRGMQKYEALPADDIGLQRTISHFYFDDRRVSSGELRSVASKWGQWKGLAAFYFVIASIMDLRTG